MSTNTKKLGLVKPDWTVDEVLPTIQAIADNFQIIDDAWDDYASSPPTSGLWKERKQFLATSLAVGGYLGWVNIREGQASPKWEKLKLHPLDATVVPKIDNGHYYRCTQAGYSGVTEPIFPVSTAGQVQDTRGANTWISNHLYAIEDIVFPQTDNGRFYVCLQAGLSGDAEPPWLVVDGGTTYDGNVSWKSYRIAKWQESGIAALFRPFGKIE